jgi:2-desacetyl-2-hydroxyethyl bacteriochlorophyllide A dehydrogenase
MLQITLDEPGKLTAADVAQPRPGPGQALVRVHRIGVCGTDLHAFAGKQPFFSYPRVLGHELGVEVVELGEGAEAEGIVPGARCSVEPYLNCGRCTACRRGTPNCCAELKVMGVHVDGGMRPFLTLPAEKLHASSQLDYEQLALVETLGIGAHAVERANVHPEDYVLVIGAGPIGLSVIQFALVTRAHLVVADVSESRLAFCREKLGVKHTVLAGPNLANELKAISGGDLPNVVIDATGNSKSMAGTFELASHGGRIVFVGLFQGDLTFNDPNFHRRELTLLASRNSMPSTFRAIIRLVESGRVDTRPWITHRFKLPEIPQVFPTEISGNPMVLKAMIEVPA